MVTSRERLHVGGEIIHEVGGIGVPSQSASSESVQSSEAVRLFLARAMEAAPSLQPTADDMGEIASIVRHLDGVPLAIELVAARTRIVPISDLQHRMERSLLEFKNRRRGGDPRHATLEAAIGWSWDLLSDTEQRVLAQLSLFRGPFDLVMVEGVIGESQIAGQSVLDLLESLSEKSLLTHQESGSVGSFSLLESVREYARSQLRDKPDARRRQSLFFARFADQWTEKVWDGSDSSAVERLFNASENLQAALDWAIETSDSATALSTAFGLLLNRNPHDVMDTRLANQVRALSLAQDNDQGATLPYLRLIVGMGSVLAKAGLADRASVHVAEALELAKTLDSDLLLRRAHWSEAEVDFHRGQAERSASTLKEWLPPLAKCQHLRSQFLQSLGVVLTESGRLEEARQALQEADQIATQGGFERTRGGVLATRASLLVKLGRLNEAVAVNQAQLDLSIANGWNGLVLSALYKQGLVLLEMGRIQSSLEAFNGCRLESARRGAAQPESWSLGREALCLLVLGRQEDAAALLAMTPGGGERNAVFRLSLCLVRALALWRLGELDQALNVAKSEFAHGTPETASPFIPVLLAASSGLALLVGASETGQDFRDRTKRALASCTYPAVEIMSQLLVACGEPRVEGVAPEALLAAIDSCWSDRDIGAYKFFLALGVSLYLQAASDRRAENLMLIAESRPEGLILDQSARRVRPPGSDWKELSKKPTLWNVLEVLAVAAREQPGVPITIDELVKALWPGENIMPDAIANRLYVLISSARKLGLRDSLAKDQNGYRLDPALPLLFLNY